MEQRRRLELDDARHPKQLRKTLRGSEFTTLSTNGNRLFSQAHAAILNEIDHPFELELWCRVSRQAVSTLLQHKSITGLSLLHCPEPHGAYGDLSVSPTLTKLSSHDLDTATIDMVLSNEGWQSLSIQAAKLTRSALDAIAAMRNLKYLDLEGCRISDDDVAVLSRSKSIEDLYLCGCHVGTRGLFHLLAMPQLKALDIWATNVAETDIAQLATLQHLEYLSLGNYDDFPQMDGAQLVTQLMMIPNLKRVWLDGPLLSQNDHDRLSSHCEIIRN